MDPKIIFEDKEILVLDKPSGWIVNEAATTKGQNVLQSWLSKLDYPLAKSREYRSGIVHRLDKETSGIILIAKTESVFRVLQQQFKDREVDKTYVALAHGKVTPKEGKITAPVGRLPWRRDRFGVLPGGREATTQYQVIKDYSLNGKDYSLLELYPATGRTHQIRIHLKYLGHPIVGDEFYAGRKTARHDRTWCPRLFLHAAKISFKDPSGGTKTFTSALPEELQKLL